MAELLDEFKKEKESDSMTIRKVTDNIEILMTGGMIISTSGAIYSGLLKIDTAEDLVDIEDFSECVEHIEPMTDRELAQAKEIEDLKAQLASGEYISVNKEVRSRKKRVKYARSDEMKIAQDWKYEKSIGTKLKKKDFAKKYNISGNYLTSILVSFGVETKRRNNTKVNASIDTGECDE